MNRISRFWKKRDSRKSSNTITSTTTPPTNQTNNFLNTPIRYVCLSALDQSTTALRQRLSTLHRLVLVETLNSIADKYSDVENGYSSINTTRSVFPFHSSSKQTEDQKLDEISLSIMLDNVNFSPGISIEDFVESIKEALPVVLCDNYSYNLPRQTIDDMIEKVSNQDWDGWLNLTAAAATFHEAELSIHLVDEETSLLASFPSQQASLGLNQYLHDGRQYIANNLLQSTDSQRLCNFREMMIFLLSCSRAINIQLATFNERQELSRSIYSAPSQEALTSVVSKYLFEQDSFMNDATRRVNVENAIKVGRWDLLFRENHLDCNELPTSQQRFLSQTGLVVAMHSSLDDHSYGGSSIDTSSFEICAICLDFIKDDIQGAPISLRCHHKFCTSCIEEWAAHKSTCPTCRKPFQPVYRQMPGLGSRLESHDRPLRQLGHEEEEREERRKCYANLILFSLLCMYLYSPTLAALAVFSVTFILCMISCWIFVCNVFRSFF